VTSLHPQSTLIVSTARRRTLGDRAFPAAAARAYNSLLSFVRDEQSLAAFRQQRKTVLFRHPLARMPEPRHC